MDLSVLCRSCMQELSPSEIESYNKHAIDDKFCYCTHIKISKDDQLPKQFCSNCLSQIDLSYKFITKAQKVNIALNNILQRKRIDQSVPIETEIFHCDIKKDDINNTENYDSDNIYNEEIAQDEKKELNLTEIDFKHSTSIIIKTENAIQEELAIAYVPDIKPCLTRKATNRQGKARKKTKKKGGKKCSKTAQTLGTYKFKKKNCCCPICDKTFKSKIWLSNHMRKEHNMNTLELVKKYPKTFTEQSDLKSNSTIDMTTSESLPHQVSCAECGEQFASHRQLSVHAQTHDNATGSRPYICDYCLVRFKAKFHLRVHITTVHMNTKPHLCSVCGASFAQLSNLKWHMATHSSAKPFGCELCTFVTNSPYALNRHRRRHDPAKYYTHQCPQCDKMFSNSYGLKRHMRRHTGARPYKCTHCALGFIDSWKRKVHIMSRHKMLLSELQWLPMDPGAVSTEDTGDTSTP